MRYLLHVDGTMMDTLRQFVARVNAWGAARRPFLFVVDYEMQHPWGMPLDALPDDVWFEVPSMGVSPPHSGLPTDVRFEVTPVAFSQYRKAFQRAMDHLQRGDTYLLNLTFPSRLRTNLSPAAMYHRARAPYKLYFRDRFVVFSPECFVRIQGNAIHTFPMKGTAPAEAAGALEALLANEKEQWEHATVVDLLRNDLSLVAERVEVMRYRFPLRVSTHAGDLWQISSEIVGRLRPGWHAHVGSLLLRLLPAGSISGAPKARTVRIIRSIEQNPRGFFTGVFGIYDGQGVESAVMIRYVERRRDGTLWFRSGGGITAYSEARAEYEEMIRKAALPQ